MSRIAAQVLPNEAPFNVGRLSPIEPTFDSAEKVIEALCPSYSRDNRVYRIEVDCITGEFCCACEAFQFRSSRTSPYNRQRAGTFIENAAKAKGYELLPLITRNPSGLCPHGKRMRSLLKRRGLWPAMKTIESELEKRLDAAKPKSNA